MSGETTSELVERVREALERLACDGPVTQAEYVGPADGALTELQHRRGRLRAHPHDEAFPWPTNVDAGIVALRNALPLIADVVEAAERAQHTRHLLDLTPTEFEEAITKYDAALAALREYLGAA